MRTRTRTAITASVLLLAPLGAGSAPSSAAPTVVPGTPALSRFTEQLAVPPVLDLRGTDPGSSYQRDPVTGAVRIALDEVVGTHRFHADLPATPTFAYSLPGSTPPNSYLGPTLEVRSGTPLQMTVRNLLGDGTRVVHPFEGSFDPSLPGAQQDLERRAVPTAVHLHGGHTPPDSDGGPEDTFYPVLAAGVDATTKAVPDRSTEPGQVPGSYTYAYPNDQDAAGLWIHDHALGATRFNPKSGLAAAYWVRDDWDTGEPDNPLHLPTGSPRAAGRPAGRAVPAGRRLRLPDERDRLPRRLGAGVVR